MEEIKKNMFFANKIKALRLAKGISQEELASQLGYQRQTASQWERLGAVPRTEALQKLADFFGVTIDELLGREIPVKNEPEKVSARDQRDLDKFLEQSEVMFDGELHQLDDEGREMLRDALKYAFWQAKEKNKRKPKKE